MTPKNGATLWTRPRTLSTFALVVLVSASVACGGSRDQAVVDEVPPPEATAPADEESESPPNASVGYDYQTVKPSRCEKSESLGKKGSIDLVLKPANLIATPFIPMCITDVKVDEVEVTITNRTTYAHNLIVEGNDFELALPPQDSASVTVALGSQEEIGFQCTLHPPMYGAFFR